MYVASDSDEGEGSQEDEADIAGDRLSDVESIDQQGDENSSCLAGPRGRLEQHCSQA